jgi:hypothetical protein
LKKTDSVWERGGAFAQQLAQHFLCYRAIPG